MSPEAQKFATYPGGRPGASATAPDRDYHELWFRLVRFPWASIVLVPTHDLEAAAKVATSLAEIGTSLRVIPVTAIVADTIDYATVRSLVAQQPRLAGGGWRAVADGLAQRPPPADDSRGATPRAVAGQTIIAIKPVVDEPLGIAIAQAADAVVLCVEIGKSRLAAARRTIELVGPDRFAGALLIR